MLVDPLPSPEQPPQSLNLMALGSLNLFMFSRTVLTLTLFVLLIACHTEGKTDKPEPNALSRNKNTA